MRPYSILAGKKVDHGHLPKLWDQAKLVLAGRSGGNTFALILGQNPFATWDVNDRYHDCANLVPQTVAKRLAAARQDPGAGTNRQGTGGSAVSRAAQRPRFDDAWHAALEIAENATRIGFDVVLVRDLLGRVSIVIADSTARQFSPNDRAELERQLRDRCAPFVGDRPVLLATELFTPDSLVSAPDLIQLREANAGGRQGGLAVLERGVVGREWQQIESRPLTNRVTLYGFKGGVGRSTATVVLAQHLATAGYCVLITDLDLESPGVSAVALDPAEIPEYGLVDVLVETAVGDQGTLDCVARSSRLRPAGNGEVWIAPAGGRPRSDYFYLPKLNRVYLDTPVLGTGDPQTTPFAKRLETAVGYCVDAVEQRSRRPDVVLLDARAGLQDIAAIAITRLSELSLLFGVDNAPTWNGYRELFRHWSSDVRLARLIRDRLRIVAAMVPATHETEYLDVFRDKAHALFSEFLYDEAAPADLDAFSPSLSDTDAPHSPIPILFSTDLVGVDTARKPDWLEQEFVQAAFSGFAREAADLIVGTRGDDR